MLRDLAVQATAAAEANDHGLVDRFVKRLAPPMKGAEVALRRPKELGAEACFGWDSTAQKQATSEALCDIFGASEVQETSVAPTEAIEGGFLASTYEISAELVEKQNRKLPNNRGGRSLKTSEKNTASDGLHARAVAECWKPASDEVASKLSDYLQMLLGSGWVPDEFKSGDTFRLRKQDKNGTDPMKSWRCLNLLNHIGKAVTRRAKDPFEQELVETTSRKQCGAERGRSKCDAVATVTKSHAKWRDMYKRLPRGKQAQRMISFFVDLSKAFDLTPRAALWRHRREKCRNREHAVAMEQIHNRLAER